MFGPVHHIGYRVGDLDGAIAYYQKTFDGKLGYREEITQRGIEIAFVQMGDALVEFIRSLDGSNPQEVTIDHVAFLVKDIEATLAKCRERGLPLIDQTPRTSPMGYKVAFLAPEAGKGARLQLVQPV